MTKLVQIKNRIFLRSNHLAKAIFVFIRRTLQKQEMRTSKSTTSLYKKQRITSSKLCYPGACKITRICAFKMRELDIFAWSNLQSLHVQANEKNSTRNWNMCCLVYLLVNISNTIQFCCDLDCWIDLQSIT